MIQIATLVVSGMSFLVSLVGLVLTLRSNRESRKVNWLKNFAEEGLALAQHSRAHHLAQKLQFTQKDEEDEAVRWVLDRATDLKIKCTRQQAAKLVAIARK